MKIGDVNRRLDLPGNAYNFASEVSPDFLFVREGLLFLLVFLYEPLSSPSL